MHPNSMGVEAPVLGPLPDLALCFSSSYCSSVHIILCDKFAIVGNMFSWVL